MRIAGVVQPNLGRSVYSQIFDGGSEKTYKNQIAVENASG